MTDLRRELAESKAAKYGIPNIYSVNEMMADPEIEIILNITNPCAHAEVALAALEAGKCVYN